MSSSPAAPQRSSWPWRSRSRRRNSESSVPSLKEVTTARNSLSAADAQGADAIRSKAAEFLASYRVERHSTDQEAVIVGASPFKNARRTHSRPPPAFFNRYNRHALSATASQRYSLGGYNDDALLKPPSPRVRISSFGEPAPASIPTAASPFEGFPFQPWSLTDCIPITMYPPEEQEFVLRTQRASARVQQITGSQTSGKAPEMDRVPMIHMPTAFPDGPVPTLERPGGYNKPRRLSNSSVSTASSSAVSGRDSFDGRIRSASISSSQTSIESWPNSPGVAPRSNPTWQMQGGPHGQYHPWQRPAPIKTYRRRAQQGELFAALPGEVLELILDELRKLHLRPGSSSCATCWMRDCCSAAVSARKFLKYAREALYQHIYLVGHEGPNMKKRTKSAYGSRLVLLRRTLRANEQIAVLVRSLKPPALPPGVGAVEYNDLVASVVMACPNLERLVGFYPTYDHSFQRLFQALSTRPKLKEMNWILEPSTAQQQNRPRSAAQNTRWGQGELQPRESRLFLDYHRDWRQLTTLVVHCQRGANLSPSALLRDTIRTLPSLQNLYLSHIPHPAFNDNVLVSLPRLEKLSLNHCTGVTTAGLSCMATRPNSASIKTLTLIHQDVESLPAIARILAYLTSLETFNIVQTYAPAMPPDEYMIFYPYLASQSLSRLHWDIPYLPTSATAADAILARSISAGGFPSLRTLCAPNDPEGIFQTLCAPRARIDHPTDRYRGGQAHYHAGHTRNASSFSSTHTGGRRSSFANGGGSAAGFSTPPPARPAFAPPDALLMMSVPNSNLHQARLAAQARLEAAQRFPRYFVNVVDEHGAVVDKFGVGAFLGTVESRVRYVLTPDGSLGGTDEGGGLVTVEGMVRDDGGEALVLGGPGGDQGKGGKKKGKGHDTSGTGEGTDGEGGNVRTREGCTGRWNTFSGAVVDKKDRERWWHQERGRWRRVELS
ncbi:hypothetical protein MMYC01_206295 [Madurella mycetomatis]|uniref:F-box domain-containing protein n=1 Tax=Madurella mycetomatis TaxID=100816 RepID=A0A175VYP4_9PEZI|nr:hypothetical protein MMYC01_206295 [Madurella mycetomatis]